MAFVYAELPAWSEAVNVVPQPQPKKTKKTTQVMKEAKKKLYKFLHRQRDEWYTRASPAQKELHSKLANELDDLIQAKLHRLQHKKDNWCASCRQRYFRVAPSSDDGSWCFDEPDFRKWLKTGRLPLSITLETDNGRCDYLFSELQTCYHHAQTNVT